MILACSTSLGSGFPLETALDRIAQTGLPEVDLLAIEGWAHLNPSALADDWEASVARLESLLRDRGQRLVSLNAMTGPKLHQRGPDEGRRREVETAALVRLMRLHGFSAIALQPPLKWQETWSDEEQDLCLETLREQLAVAAGAGVVFALELHSRSPFESMAQVRRLLERLPEIPLVYDPTHFVLQGLPIRETGFLLANARHVHLRDAAPGQLQAPFGQGAVDFDWVLGSLRDRGYDGVISLEYLGGRDCPFDVVDSARRLADQVRSVWGASQR